ncbi:MAG TPA: hypothetical protein VD886_19695 [Herpetosiphonaceae bacterium]|nr:hypothetical protein [Herpetosiphonaceae bacterium]
MGKILRWSVLIAVFLAGGLFGPAPRNAAAEIPLADVRSSFQIQNISSEPATCSYDIYADAGGAPIFSQPIASAVPVDGSILVYTRAAAHGGTGIPEGLHSGVVRCDRDVAAVVVFQNDLKRDSYIATAPASTMYVPIAYKNYYNFTSSIRIQNTAATSQTVQVTYYAPGSSIPAATGSAFLGANGSVTLDQAAVAELKNGLTYSAIIAGTAPVAVNVTIAGLPGSAVELHLYSYRGFSRGATITYTPTVLRDYYGFNSSTTVLNIGAQAANVKRIFTNGAVDTYTIQPNTSVAILDFLNPKLDNNRMVYGSIIESTNGQPLIAVVNFSSLARSRASASEGLTVADSGTTILIPSAVKRFYGYNSSISCLNIGSAPTSIRATYSNTAIRDKVVASQLGQYQHANMYQLLDPELPDGYLGSATLTADQPLLCEVHQDQNEPMFFDQKKDMYAAYNGIVASAESKTLSIPVIRSTK